MAMGQRPDGPQETFWVETAALAKSPRGAATPRTVNGYIPQHNETSHAWFRHHHRHLMGELAGVRRSSSAVCNRLTISGCAS